MLKLKILRLVKNFLKVYFQVIVTFSFIVWGSSPVWAGDHENPDFQEFLDGLIVTDCGGNGKRDWYGNPNAQDNSTRLYRSFSLPPCQPIDLVCERTEPYDDIPMRLGEIDTRSEPTPTTYRETIFGTFGTPSSGKPSPRAGNIRRGSRSARRVEFTARYTYSGKAKDPLSSACQWSAGEGCYEARGPNQMFNCFELSRSSPEVCERKSNPEILPRFGSSSADDIRPVNYAEKGIPTLPTHRSNSAPTTKRDQVAIEQNLRNLDAFFVRPELSEQPSGNSGPHYKDQVCGAKSSNDYLVSEDFFVCLEIRQEPSSLIQEPSSRTKKRVERGRGRPRNCSKTKPRHGGEALESEFCLELQPGKPNKSTSGMVAGKFTCRKVKFHAPAK